MIQIIPDGVLESVARTLGEGLTGTKITNILSGAGIADVSGESTKWRRLYHAFVRVQAEDGCGNKVGVIVESAMHPSRWSGDLEREKFSHVREDVNRAIVMIGLELGADGKLKSVRAATSLDEAHERSNRLRAILQKRAVHPAVLASCSKLVLRDDNYFHAAFEVTKGIADRLRTMVSSSLDGSRLIDETLECGSRPFPLVALNRYDSDSLKNEQKGIAHLTRGLFHAFRNVTAHEPASAWTITELDALDMISTASLIHRRLDNATVTAAFQPTMT